ncbi:MAG: pilus assembly protein TadG-related protein [Nitratireductor sp.]
MFQQIRSFVADRRGNFAIIFGLSLVPVIGLAGAAVDYSRILRAESKLQSASDAAALAAASSGSDINDMRRIAASFLESNAPEMNPVAETTISANKLTVVARASINLPVLSAIGWPEANLEITSEIESAFPLGGGRVNANVDGGVSAQVAETQIALARRQFARIIRKMPQHMREEMQRQFEAEIARARRAGISTTGDLRLTR